MGNFKNNNHIRSARKWLMRAEEALDNDCEVRAELDLILAQAELQHVRETKRSASWFQKYRLVMNGLAFCLALVIATAGVGGAYVWLHSKNMQASPYGEMTEKELSSERKSEREYSRLEPSQEVHTYVVQDKNLSPANETINSEKHATPAQSKPDGAVITPEPDKGKAVVQEGAVPTAAAVKNVSTVGSKSPENEADVVLAQTDMQKLVHAAGKSLRGGRPGSKSEGGNE